MARDLETTVQGFLADLGLLGAIRSVVLYGSAATSGYVPGKSDLNFLIVATDVSTGLLSDLGSRMKSWAKRRISPPLLIGEGFLCRSTDSYPLEILGMMAAYRVLRGPDPLAGLSPAPEHIRLQVEREAKAKEILLRTGFVQSSGRHREMARYLAGALPAVDAMLRGMLRIEGGPWQGAGPEMRAEAVTRFGLDAGVLRDLHEIRYGGKADRDAVESLYGRTLALIATIAQRSDRQADQV